MVAMIRVDSNIFLICEQGPQRKQVDMSAMMLPRE